MAKITEYPRATAFDANDVLLKDGTNGTKTITIEDFVATVSDTTTTTNGKLAKAGEVSAIGSIVYEKSITVLPDTIKGSCEIRGLTAGKGVFCGTRNCSQFLPIKNTTYSNNGVTITVSGNTVTVNGTPTSAMNYSFADGTTKQGADLAAMSLDLPIHEYALSMYVTGGTAPNGYPSLAIRSKSSGNVVLAQNNVGNFTMDSSTCGGFYMALTANRAYNNLVFVIGLFPFTTGITSAIKGEASHVTTYSSDGIYELDGYTWSDGSPTVTWYKSKFPKKPVVLYSTRSILYTGITQTVDIYIPCKTGYVNYIFGHTVGSTSDVWRLVQIDAVNDAFARTYHITRLGETEMAFEVVGNDSSTFVGGYTHGYERLVNGSFFAVLDGKAVDITTVTTLTEFSKLQFFLVTNMYDPADNTTLLGVHSREWSFDETGMLLTQNIEYKSSFTVKNFNMPMLCTLRGNDAQSALQITDTYIDDSNFTTYDVSTSGFTNYPNQLKTRPKKIYLTGAASGVEASVEILEQPEDGMRAGGSYLSNNADYNKIYCVICGFSNDDDDYKQVANGDMWKTKTKFEIKIG